MRLPEWGLSTDGLVDWLVQALALGISSFDPADIDGAESVEVAFGAAPARSPGLRRRLQIGTKCGIKLVTKARSGHGIKSDDSSRAHGVASVNKSQRALRTDRIDPLLLLLHQPDLLLDPDEAAETFGRLQAAVKVLMVGFSNHRSDQGYAAPARAAGSASLRVFAAAVAGSGRRHTGAISGPGSAGHGLVALGRWAVFQPTRRTGAAHAGRAARNGIAVW